MISRWTNLSISLILIFGLLLCASSTSNAEEEKDGKASEEFGQGVIWLPRITFPPSDPTQESGYLPLLDRDIYYKHLRYNIYLSLKRGLEVTVDESDFYLRIGGRLYLDFAKYFEDKNDLGSGGLGIRTFMIEGNGRFSEQWLYRLSIGGLTNGGRFDGTEAFLDDAYVTYLGTKTAWTFGQHGEPFSLEERTSSLNGTFMEASLPNAMVPGKNVGLSIFRTGNRWSLNAGLFTEDLRSGKDVADQGIGFTGRFVFRPESPSETLYHLGGSSSYRLVRGDDPVFYRARPESGLTDVRYVNTGEIPGADAVARAGIEAALQKGPLCIQAEYVAAYVDRDARYDNLFFHGWYASLSWFVTGESRRYFSREAIFGYPEVKSKYGAVELAARYSMLDLSHGSVLGGKERNITFGINWYITSKARLMTNYILVFADDNADDDGTVLGDDEPHIFQMRLQVRF